MYTALIGAHDLIQSFDVKLQDLSPEAYDARKRHSQDMIEAATQIRAQQVDTLSSEDVIFLDLFENIHKELVASMECAKSYLMPLNSIGAGWVTC